MVAAEDDAIRPIVAVNVFNTTKGNSRQIYALLDTGSNKDVIDEELVKELDLPAHYEMMEVSVLGKDSIGPRQVASFSINSLEGNYEAEIRGAMVAKLLTSQSDIPPAKRNFSDYSHLRKKPPFHQH